MRLTGSRAYYRPTPPKMPPGLVELIQDLSREVLKNNPTDIYSFCASHVHQQLEIRDGPLLKKPISLEEKIARAQKRVRQRAEKRRQQYDNDLLRQRSGEDPDINATSNFNKDYTPSLPLQEPTAVNTLETLIHHEQEFVNSSEVSDDPGTGINTPSEHSQFENIDEAITNNDDLKNENNTKAAVVAHESINNSNMVNSTNEASDNIITQDVSLNKIPKTEYNDTNEDMLEKEIQADKMNLKVQESRAGGEITHDGDDSCKENHEFGATASGLQEFVEGGTTQNLSSPLNSMTVDKDCVDDSTEQIVEDSAKIEAKNIADNELDEQNSLTQTNDVAESQSDSFDPSNNIEETKQSNDTQSIQQSINSDITDQSTMVERVVLTTNSNNIINEDEEGNKEMNTIDTSKESPTMELQDPLINSDLMESLLKTHPDSDIVTLMTQESTNDERKKHDAHDSTNAIESYTITELPPVYKDNTETLMTVSGHEDLPTNVQPQSQMNTIDLIDNSIVASNENNNNGVNDVNNSEEDTPTKLIEGPHISHQDSSSMDLETAAVTIQKVFRSFLFKSRASTFDDSVNDETIFLNEDDKNKEDRNFPIAGSLNERRPHGITRMDTVLQTVNEEKSLSLSTDDSSTLSSAATVIQAHVRGFLVRNKLNSNKTISTNSLAASNSNEPSLTSLEMDNDQNKNKTVLNIHIVPEGGNYLSRDESLITSMDLSLDSSPPSSINLHPLGYDKSERRKQLKREDAIQSISPPSNQSGKLSEDIDSVKELPLNDHVVTTGHSAEYNNSEKDDSLEGTSEENVKIAHVENNTLETIVNLNEIPGNIEDDTDNQKSEIKQKRKSLTKQSSDEMDVVSPFITNEDIISSDMKLMHSGEFHDAVLPTKVSRSDTSVASEFKNVLVYFLLWNHS